MRSIRAIICLCLFSISAQAGFSSNDPIGSSRFEQRQLYVEAIDAIKSGQRGKASRLKERLRDYPLYPYVEYTEKIYNIAREPAESILDFLDRYPGSPLADMLLENWIFVLAQQHEWATLVQHYDESLTGRRNACSYAYALYRVGDEARAFEQAKKLWLVNFSQPDECDDIFYLWREAGQLDRETAWRRFAMTLDANNASLAGYLTRYLDDADQPLANNFKLVHRSPNYVRQQKRFPTDDAHTREVILHGLRRLSTRNPEAAWKALQEYAPRYAFDPIALEDTRAYIGIRLALDGDETGLLDKLPAGLQHHPDLVEARIRLALRRLDWSDVLVLIHLLPDDLQQTPRWRFWKARVLAASQSPEDRADAREIFEDLSRLRRFYGFLAADALGVDYAFEDSPVRITRDETLNLEAAPAIQRAFELFALNERYRARREWYYATRNFSTREQLVAARVARKWGWHRQAIQAMIDAEAWDDLDIRFPLAYYDNFVSNARTWDIPLHWSFAIARQESAFMPDARSVAGAMGIMQIMPATARLTAREHGLQLDSSDQLKEPDINIRLGSAYLGTMLRRFGDNRVIASAAYNAGPARVETWLDPTLPLDVWIETIPFGETRNYVQNVLTFAVIYARRLSLTQPFIYAHERQDFGNQRVSVAE